MSIANLLRNETRRLTYRRRKKAAQRMVRVFERREAAEAAEMRWAQRYWEANLHFVEIVRRGAIRPFEAIQQVDFAIPLVTEEELVFGELMGLPPMYECVRCKQLFRREASDPDHAGVCPLCVREVMADPPSFKPDMDAADPYWGNL